MPSLRVETSFQSTSPLGLDIDVPTSYHTPLENPAISIMRSKINAWTYEHASTPEAEIESKPEESGASNGAASAKS